MAKAAVRYVDEQVVTTITKVAGVTLELSQEEAEVVLALTGNVAGGGKNRQLTSRVFHALYEAGVAPSHVTGKGIKASVEFKEDDIYG